MGLFRSLIKSILDKLLPSRLAVVQKAEITDMLVDMQKRVEQGTEKIDNQIPVLQKILKDIERFEDPPTPKSTLTKKLEEYAKKTGSDRIELYTEKFAIQYAKGNKKGIQPYKKAAEFSKKIGLGLNAGHDLNLDNLSFFAREIPELDEVSIGHALISDALYLGLENTIQLYRRALKIEDGIEL